MKLEGNLDFDTKKGLQSAEFTSVRLVARATRHRSRSTPIRNGYQVRLRGDQLDLKPMLQRFFSLSRLSDRRSAGDGGQADHCGGPELKRALGFYKTTAFNVNLDLVLRGADLQRVNLQANLGGDPSVSVTTNPTPDGKVMSVAFNDLGTLLRLMNVYPNVEGGEAVWWCETIDDQKIDGQFALRNFAFVNEGNVAQNFSAMTPSPGS